MILEQTLQRQSSTGRFGKIELERHEFTTVFLPLSLSPIFERVPHAVRVFSHFELFSDAIRHVGENWRARKKGIVASYSLALFGISQRRWG